ncbi:hypothetical protein GpartN1_g631.t1 [Galdieria partita]|uniref:BZIP domain-containing protein n=1 Tax=Galdieria partita TaxID=83374 RepID=A0A9C7PQU6_9RHOD|nr:hypothetical protein GpartN1_g631.t1 [Galdieria partita]
MEHDRRTSIQYLLQARNEELTTPSREPPDRHQQNVESRNPAKNTRISDFENIDSMFTQPTTVEESQVQRPSLTDRTTDIKRNRSTQHSFTTIHQLSEWKQDDLNTSIEWFPFQERPENYGKVSRVEAGIGQYYPILSTEYSFQRSSTTSTSHSSSFPPRQEFTKTASPHEIETTSLQPQTTTNEDIATVGTRGSISNESQVREEISPGTSQRTKRPALDEEERKRMRLIKNRASAERSRRKQRERLEELVYKVKCLRQENISLKQDHLALLEYVDNLKTCMRQSGILVESVPVPYLHYPTSESVIEQLGRES